MRRLSEPLYAPEAEAAAASGLGALPQWRLDDLYESLDSPSFAADLGRAQTDAKAFAETWRGKLAGVAASPGAGVRLAEAVAA